MAETQLVVAQGSVVVAAAAGAQGAGLAAGSAAALLPLAAAASAAVAATAATAVGIAHCRKRRRLASNLESRDEELAELRAQISGLVRQTQVHSEGVSALRALIGHEVQRAVTRTSEALHSKIAALEKDLEALRAETSKAKEEQAIIAQAHCDAVEKMCAETKKDLEELRAETSKAKEDLEELRAETSKAKEDLEELRAETSKAKEDLEALRAETSKAQEDLEALRAETSKAQEDVKAQLNEVTRKHADTDMIAQLALGHLAGNVPKVAKHIGGEELNAALVKLRGEDAQQRVGAVEALRGLGGSSPAAGAAARHALVAALRRDANSKVRMQAARDLGLFLPDATLVPHLTATLREDENHYVRLYAAMSLARVGAPAALRAVEALTSAMRTASNERVRAAAAGALLALDAQGLTSEAQGVALQVLRSGGVWADRMCAAWAVGCGRGPEARAALEKAASDDPDKSVRAEAKQALETLRA